MKKKLYRSKKDRIIGGVMGGIAEYFNISSSWIRLLFVILLFVFYSYFRFVGFFLGAFIYYFASSLIPFSRDEFSTGDFSKNKSVFKDGEIQGEAREIPPDESK